MEKESDYQRLLAGRGPGVGGNIPTLKELILSRSYCFDDRLTDPEGVRKFYEKYIRGGNDPMKQPDIEDFVPYSNLEGVCRDDTNNAGEVYNSIVKGPPSSLEWEAVMGLYDKWSIDSGSNSSCCKSEYHQYVGFSIDEEENKVTVISRIVRYNYCTDVGGSSRYKPAIDFDDPPSLKEILIHKPIWLEYFIWLPIELIDSLDID